MLRLYYGGIVGELNALIDSTTYECDINMIGWVVPGRDVACYV